MIQMLFAVIADDIRAGIGEIAEDLTAGCRPQRLQHRLRKAVRIGFHRDGRDQSCDLPVTGRCVLACGALCALAVGGSRRGNRLAAADPVNIEQSHFLHIRHMELSGCEAGTERMRSGIAEAVCIRQLAAAAAVEHDQKNALCHIGFLLLNSL